MKGAGWIALVMATFVAVPTFGVITSDQELVEDLRQALRQDDSDVLFGSSMTLSLLGSKAVSPLLEALSDADPIVRANAATALGWASNEGNQPRPEVIRALMGALSDEDRRVRFNASITLNSVDNPEVQEAVDRYRKEEALRKW